MTKLLVVLRNLAKARKRSGCSVDGIGNLHAWNIFILEKKSSPSQPSHVSLVPEA